MNVVYYYLSKALTKTSAGAGRCCCRSKVASYNAQDKIQYKLSIKYKWQRLLTTIHTLASMRCLRNVLFSNLHQAMTSSHNRIWISNVSGTAATMFRIFRTIFAVLALGIFPKKSLLDCSSVMTVSKFLASVYSFDNLHLKESEEQHLKYKDMN